jgi:hypothetical protein
LRLTDWAAQVVSPLDDDLRTQPAMNVAQEKLGKGPKSLDNWQSAP